MWHKMMNYNIVVMLHKMVNYDLVTRRTLYVYAFMNHYAVRYTEY